MAGLATEEEAILFAELDEFTFHYGWISN